MAVVGRGPEHVRSTAVQTTQILTDKEIVTLRLTAMPGGVLGKELQAMFTVCGVAAIADTRKPFSSS